MHRTAVLFALVSAGISADATQAQTVIDDSAAQTPRSAEVIRVVASQLRDADSAQIRGLKRIVDDNYCGWVNAKTRSGGYAGFRPFIVSLAPPAYAIFQGYGNEGQLDPGATVISMPAPGKGCGIKQ